MIRILHIEDLATDAELVARVLAKSSLQFNIDVVSAREDFIAAVNNNPPDIILSDHCLPAFDSTDALNILKELQLDLPFILVTATMTEEFAVETMKRGASDYVLKDRLQRLPAAISNAIAKFKIKEARQRDFREIADYRYALDQSALVVVTSESFIVKYVNENFCSVSGRHRDSLLMTPFFDVVDTSAAEIDVNQIIQTVRKGDVWKNELKLSGKDNRTIWVECTIVPFKSGGNAIPYKYLFVMMDLTDVKVSRQNLVLAHEKLLFHIENSPLGFIEWEVDGSIHTFSNQAAKIFKVKSVDLEAIQNIYKIRVHEDDRWQIGRNIQRLISGINERISVVIRNYTMDGDMIWCEWFNSVLKDKSGAITIFSFVQDITQRKTAERDLQLSEMRLNEAQALSHICNWEYDISSNRFICSDEFYRIFDLDRNLFPETIESFISLLHPDDIKRCKVIIESAIENLSASSFNFRFLDKDRNIRYGFTEWWFDFDSKGRAVRIYGILMDNTSAKVTEIEREKMIAEILWRNKDLEQFSYIISHNLRAPVANIIGFSEILKNNTIAGEEQQDLLDSLSVSVKKLDEVIKDLNLILQMKREVNAAKVIISFKKLILEVKESISLFGKDESIKIELNIEKDEYSTLKGYITSIFYNLLSNSIKYRRVGIPLLILVHTYSENGNMVIEYEDNGMGIDLDKNRDSVFGLYKRFHSHMEGKGMGMFMIKTQVEALGGKISLDSVVDKGTKYIIRLPA